MRNDDKVGAALWPVSYEHQARESYVKPSKPRCASGNELSVSQQELRQSLRFQSQASVGACPAPLLWRVERDFLHLTGRSCVSMMWLNGWKLFSRNRPISDVENLFRTDILNWIHSLHLSLWINERSSLHLGFAHGSATKDKAFCISDFKCLKLYKLWISSYLSLFMFFAFFFFSRNKLLLIVVDVGIKSVGAKYWTQTKFSNLNSWFSGWFLPCLHFQQRWAGGPACMGRIQCLIEYACGESSPVALSDRCSSLYQ